MIDQLTDQQAWKIISDNKSLFHYFCKGRKMPNDVFEDLVSQTQIIVFKRLKAGDLEKGSLSKIISFAVRRASYKVHADIIADAKVPTTTYSYIGSIASILKDNNRSEALEIIRSRFFPRRTMEDVIILVENMYHMNAKVSKKRAYTEDGDEYLNWFEETISGDKELQPEHRLPISIFIDLLKVKKPKLGKEDSRPMYIIGRKYGIEKELSELYPTLFSKIDCSNYGEEVKSTQIARELGVSSTRIQQIEQRFMKKLQNLARQS